MGGSSISKGERGGTTEYRIVELCYNGAATASAGGTAELPPPPASPLYRWLAFQRGSSWRILRAAPLAAAASLFHQLSLAA
jgi:hypothetical protein